MSQACWMTSVTMASLCRMMLTVYQTTAMLQRMATSPCIARASWMVPRGMMPLRSPLHLFAHELVGWSCSSSHGARGVCINQVSNKSVEHGVNGAAMEWSCYGMELLWNGVAMEWSCYGMESK